MSRVPQNLQQLHDAVPNLYSGNSVNVMQYAIHRAAILLKRTLVQIPADEAAWDRMSSTIVWVGHFRGQTPSSSERTFEDWRGKVRSAIRKGRSQVAAASAPPGVEAAWDGLQAYVERVQNTRDETGRIILPNLSSVSISTLRSRFGQLQPSAIDTAAARRELAAMGKGKAESCRRSLSFFDGLIRNRDRHPAVAGLLPAQVIGSTPTLRDAALDWEALDPGFRAEVDAAVSRAIHASGRRPDAFGGRLGPDPLAEARRARRGRGKRIRKPDQARKNFMRALSWLIRHAYPDRREAARLRSFSELMTPEIVRRATDAYVARADKDPALLEAGQTSTGAGMLARLMTLAERNDLGDEVLWEIEDCALREVIDNRADCEMSATRREFVRLLDADPAVARAILSAPATLLEEVVRGMARWDALGRNKRIHVLKLGMAATMWAIQIARPVRTFNVNDMTVGQDGSELRRPAREGAQAQIVIDRRRVKNRKDVEHAVPRHLWEIIAYWIDELRPRWIEIHKKYGFTDSDRLFPGKGGGAVSRQLFNDTWSRAARFVGVPGLTPHMIRHVAATIYLAVHPGDYAVVAALLRDAVKTVEAFYARGEGRRAAALFAETIAMFNAPAAALIYRRAA